MFSAKETAPLPHDIPTRLNAVLKHALTGINQYFLHARMLKHKGFMKLADFEYKESLDTMKYTDQLVNLILALDGTPNLQELGKLRIGDTVPQMLANDLALAEDTIAVLNAALTESDNSTTVTLQAMLKSENEHIAFIRKELNQIDNVGLNSYLQTQV